MLNLLGSLLFDVANFTPKPRTKGMEGGVTGDELILVNCQASTLSFRRLVLRESSGQKERGPGSFFSKAVVPRQRSKPLLASGRESTHLQSNKQWGLGWEFHVDFLARIRIIAGSEFCHQHFTQVMTPN